MASQAQRDAKIRAIYCLDLMRKGWSHSEIIRHCKEKFDVSGVSAGKYIKKATEILMSDKSSQYMEKVVKKQEERTEYILRKAIEEGRWEVANKILDTYNKLMGLYENKQKVEITSNEIQFKFGGAEIETTEGVDNDNKNV